MILLRNEPGTEDKPRTLTPDTFQIADHTSRQANEHNCYQWIRSTIQEEGIA